MALEDFLNGVPSIEEEEEEDVLSIFSKGVPEIDVSAPEIEEEEDALSIFSKGVPEIDLESSEDITYQPPFVAPSFPSPHKPKVPKKMGIEEEIELIKRSKDDVSRGFNVGMASFKNDLSMFKNMIQGGEDDGKHLEDRKRIEAAIAENPYEAETWYGKIPATLAEMAPAMASGIALSAVPGIGSALGFSMWAAQGAGMMYGDMRESGVTPETSRRVALVGGAIYSQLEKLQVGKIAKPWTKETIQKISQESLGKAAAKVAAKYGADWGTNVTQEILQDLTAIAAEETGKRVEDITALSGKEVAQKALKQAWETLKTAGPAMGVLGIPSAGRAGLSVAQEKRAMQTKAQGEETGVTEGRVEPTELEQPAVVEERPIEQKQPIEEQPAVEQPAVEQPAVEQPEVVSSKMEPPKTEQTEVEPVKPKEEEIKEVSNLEKPSKKRMNWIQKKLQDKFIYLRRFQERPTTKVTEESDAYLAQEIWHSKPEETISELMDTDVRKLKNELIKNKIDLEDVEDYAQALHAPERRQSVLRNNPKYEGRDPSGLTIEEETEIKNRVEKSGKKEVYDRLAGMIHDITEKKIDMLDKAGILPKEQIASWREYKHYVPLKGVEALEKTGSVGTAFKVASPVSKKAMGRQTKAQNILANVLNDYAETAIRVEKNNVDQKFLKLVEDNPNPKMWTITRKKSQQFLDLETMEMRWGLDPNYKYADNVLPVWRDGKQYLITIKDPNIASAMVNLGAPKMSTALKLLSSGIRYMSIINTVYSPEFIGTNQIKDWQTSMYSVLSEHKDPVKLSKQINRDYIKAARGAWRGLRGVRDNDEWTNHFYDYRKNGGKVSFFNIQNVETVHKRLLNELADLKPGMKRLPGKMFKTAGDIVLDANGAVENAVRLSMYVNLVKNGTPKPQAARIVKNVTVNFNKEGDLGKYFKALYVFSNASIQSTARMAQILKTSRGKQLAGGIVVGSFLLAELNRLLGGDDDDGIPFYDKISDFEKMNNIILMRPDGTPYFKLPVGYGVNIFKAVGDAFNHGWHTGKIDESAAMVAGSVMGSFNPMGTAPTALQMITPSQFRWLSDLYVNKNFFGGPIMKEERYGVSKSKAHTHFKSATEFSKTVAQTLNKITGGTEYQSGKIDWSPDAMDYIAEYLTGQTGKFFTRATNLLAKAVKGGEIKPHEVPFYRKVRGTVHESVDVQMFYDRVEKLEKVKKEESEIERKSPEKLNAFIKKHQKELMAADLPKDYIKTIKNLRKERKELEEMGAKDAAKVIDEQIHREVKSFNQVYNSIMD